MRGDLTKQANRRRDLVEEVRTIADVAGYMRKMIAPTRCVRQVTEALQAMDRTDSTYLAQYLDEEQLRRYGDHYREMQSLLPTGKKIGDIQQALQAAFVDVAEEADIAICAAFLTDAFPGKSTEVAVMAYADMMVITFEELELTEEEQGWRSVANCEGWPYFADYMPRAALAKAVVDLCATQKFRPTISEVISAARQHRKYLFHACHSAYQLAERRRFVDDAVRRLDQGLNTSEPVTRGAGVKGKRARAARAARDGNGCANVSPDRYETGDLS